MPTSFILSMLCSTGLSGGYGFKVGGEYEKGHYVLDHRDSVNFNNSKVNIKRSSLP